MASLHLGFLLLLTSCAQPDADGDKGHEYAGDDTGDSASDSDSGDLGVEILAPEDASVWFLETRYDIVARLTGSEDGEITVEGATAGCSPPADGILHCTVVPTSAATVRVTASAVGADGGTATTEASVTARAAVGVVPDGEAFAMGTYELMDESWFGEVAGGGFNLAQSYGTGAYTQEEWQDWAAAAGLLTMTRPSWSWSDPWGELSDDATLRALAARTEIAWWELPELPVEDDAYTDEVASVVNLIRGYDDRPTQMYFWTSSTPEDIAAYVPDVEVISPGTYPEHACQVQPWIRWRIDSARSAVATAGYSEDERPVVGTADLYGQPEDSCPELAPVLAQVRMNPLAMIAAGARGVIYFAWWYAEYELDPAWKASALDTAALITGESGLGFAVVHGEPHGDLVVEVVDGPALSEAFTPANTDTEVQYPSVHAAAWDYAGTRFVVIVNYVDEPVTVDIAGLPIENLGVEVVGESRSLATTDGVLRDGLDAWGAHVYRTPIVRDEATEARP